MITVKYNRSYNKLTVKGHAGAAQKGEDLVCSAASILVHTLAANVGHMEEVHIAAQAAVDIQDGYAQISCKAVRGFEYTVSNAFQSVCVGFEIMADKFPEFLSYKIIG